MTSVYIHSFNQKKPNKQFLGGKGYGLAIMTNLGLPVPPGFTLNTTACGDYFKSADPDGFIEMLMLEVDQAIKSLESTTGKQFGGSPPLLVSARSGAAVSMPGMMDTILNLGLNDQTVETLANLTNNPRFAFDSYRRLIQMFGNVVLEVEMSKFDLIFNQAKKSEGVANDHDLSLTALKQVISAYQDLCATAGSFPQDPKTQLALAITAVFKSWYTPRAVSYRQATGIPDDLFTAVTIQSMVFGNTGPNSGTGVMFTRNPSTGENVLFGEYLTNAQGEDVVDGSHTPMNLESLKDQSPEIYTDLLAIKQILEKHFHDMQDIEFTIEDGNLYLLQTRAGKRSALANLNIVVDLVYDGIIDRKEAVLRFAPSDLEKLLHPQFTPQALAQNQPIATGLNASPGAGVGIAVFDPKVAELFAAEGHPVVLIRPETTPNDIDGMLVSKAIVTQTGGATSHAAIVTRQFGIPCIAGCSALKLNLKKGQVTVDGHTIKQGSYVSVDGTSGHLYLGQLDTMSVSPEELPAFQTLINWVNKFRQPGLQVWANADSKGDAVTARRFGAQGIGLLRIEHAIMTAGLTQFQQYILASIRGNNDLAQRQLLDLQQILIDQFEQMFLVMSGLPIVFRLLDPPTHEFFSQENFADETIRSLQESNPMLGLRGVRLGILNPELTEVQVTAILTAAINAQGQGAKVKPKIMVPLTSYHQEYAQTATLIRDTAAELFAFTGKGVPFQVGTMIETPRATLIGPELAKDIQFASFGTNDLTQMTAGLSRDDTTKLLIEYERLGIIPNNPFQSLDPIVGRLISLFVNEAIANNPDLEIGICGEHGGDPASINFFHQAGFTYVSCSPYRLLIAQLAAAHAVLSQ